MPAAHCARLKWQWRRLTEFKSYTKGSCINILIVVQTVLMAKFRHLLGVMGVVLVNWTVIEIQRAAQRTIKKQDTLIALIGQKERRRNEISNMVLDKQAIHLIPTHSISKVSKNSWRGKQRTINISFPFNQLEQIIESLTTIRNENDEYFDDVWR